MSLPSPYACMLATCVVKKKKKNASRVRGAALAQHGKLKDLSTTTRNNNNISTQR